MTPPPSAAEIARLKKVLLRKGWELSQKLERLLAGERVSVEALLGGAKPGASPIERVRRFMALVDAQLVAIHEGRYGRCVTCGDGLPLRELAEVPWIDTCQACAAAAASSDGDSR